MCYLHNPTTHMREHHHLLHIIKNNIVQFVQWKTLLKTEKPHTNEKFKEKLKLI